MSSSANANRATRPASRWLDAAEAPIETSLAPELAYIQLLAVDGSLVGVSSAGLALLEADRTDMVIGRSIYSFVSPEYRPILEAGIERTLESGSGRIELELRGLKGSRRSLTVDVAALHDRSGQNVTVLLVLDRLTERMRLAQVQQLQTAAAALDDSTLDQEQIVERLAQITVPMLGDWCIAVTSIGPTTTQSWYHRDRTKMETLARLAESLPADRENPLGAATVAATGEPSSVDLASAIGHDQRALELLREVGLSSAMIVPIARGPRRLGTLTLAYADRSRTYDDADRTIARDLARWAALALENAELRADSKRAAALQKRILSIVSHEFRNPMAIIKVYAQLLERQLKPLDIDEEPIETARTIAATVTKMSEQLNELFDIAKLQLGEPMPLDLQPFNLLELVERIVEGRQREAPDHQIALIAEASRVVNWDPNQIERVLGRLLDTAIQEHPTGGIELSVQFENLTGIEWVTIVIKGDGPGTPNEEVEHVLGPAGLTQQSYSQLSGDGIRLINARQIVEQHYGSVSVSSIEDRGSMLTVKLPVWPPTGESEAE